MKVIRILSICLAVPTLTAVVTAAAGGARTDSDRVLRKEVIIRASLADIWRSWTTAEGLEVVSPKSNVDLRLGGPYEWFLQAEPDQWGRRGSEGCRILAYLPQEVLAFEWSFPPDIPTLRRSGAKTQVVLRFDPLGEGRVRVRFAQHGWKQGSDWDKGYAYFDEAWEWVLNEMKNHLEK